MPPFVEGYFLAFRSLSINGDQPLPCTIISKALSKVHSNFRVYRILSISGSLSYSGNIVLFLLINFLYFIGHFCGFTGRFNSITGHFTFPAIQKGFPHPKRTRKPVVPPLLAAHTAHLSRLINATLLQRVGISPKPTRFSFGLGLRSPFTYLAH